MRHVAPHRWADAAAGRVPLDERARMTEHVEACARCAAARERVLRAREAFDDVAAAEPPELRWEEIGARVYWATSQARRTTSTRATRSRARWWLVPALATAGVAATAWVALHGHGTAAPAPRATAARVTTPEPTPAPVATAGPRPTPLVGLVTLAEGEVAIAGTREPAWLFALPVVAGLPVDTGAGRLAVQLDAGTAIAVGPDSHVAIARLDQAEVHLDVDGEVSVEVSHRLPGQRFIVTAGDRTVEVRGTEFEVVHRDGHVEVSCRRGLVAVRDAADAIVEVAAGTRWEASDVEPLLAHAPAPLDAAELAELTARAPLRLPAWTDADALLRTTAPIAVAPGTSRAVRIDGVEVGRGALAVRVMSGRHLVETERATGRFAPGQWVATRDDGTPARVEVAAPTASRGAGIGVRRAQLERTVDRGRMQACLRTLTKQGLASGTHVVLEIGVDATGAVSFLNVSDTDLPSSTAACLRDTVAAVRFPAGPQATWRHRFGF